MRHFPCPLCQKQCGSETQEDGSAILEHPAPACAVEPSDLLRAYVSTVKPPLLFDTFEDAAEKLADKVQGLMGAR